MQGTLTHTTSDMRSQIVCPLSLKIAIASEGRLGAIQSYRCQPKPNIGGWETRPQKDKWQEDFFRVLNAKRDELVTLTDGKTQIYGIDQPSRTRFLFSHADGVTARTIAMRYIVAGKLRAPRNWDKVFATDAGVSLDELKRRFAELYQSQSRNHNPDDEIDIEPLGTSFFEDVADDSISLEADEESSSAEEVEEERGFAQEPAYSVVAELGLHEDEMRLEPDKPVAEHSSGLVLPIELHKPKTPIATMHRDQEWFRADMGGEYVTYYKVTNPNTGKAVWMHEGINECLSNVDLHIVNP